jgi:hypothetical protein
VSEPQLQFSHSTTDRQTGSGPKPHYSSAMC